jgi:hypothetical protein
MVLEKSHLFREKHCAAFVSRAKVSIGGKSATAVLELKF